MTFGGGFLAGMGSVGVARWGCGVRLFVVERRVSWCLVDQDDRGWLLSSDGAAKARWQLGIWFCRAGLPQWGHREVILDLWREIGSEVDSIAREF